MALTDADKQLLYECIGLFQGSTFDWYSYASWSTEGIAAVPIAAQVDFSKATTRLEVILAALTATQVARIHELLARYHTLSTNAPFRIAEGGVEGAAGLRIHWAEYLNNIRGLLETILGFHVEISDSPWTRYGSGGGRSIGLVR